MKVYGISDETYDGCGVFVLFEARHEAQDFLDLALDEARRIEDEKREWKSGERCLANRSFERKFGYTSNYFDNARIVEMEVK